MMGPEGLTGTGGLQAEINMTPLIDVLLVLLILFLVIQPVLEQAIEVEIPVDEKRETAEPPEQVVLRLDRVSGLSLNGAPVSNERLRQRLQEAFSVRSSKVLFIDGDEELTYGEVVRAMDVARAVGLEVALVPRGR